MTDEPTFDASARRLCPDGSCTGIITPQGTCSECGLAGEAPEGAPFTPPTSDESSDESSDAPKATEFVEEGGFDPNRTLCSDGTCVGVIGSNGRCDVCNRAASAGGV